MNDLELADVLDRIAKGDWQLGDDLLVTRAAQRLRDRQAVHRSRRGDRSTSIDAGDQVSDREGESLQVRAGTHRHRLLWAYSAVFPTGLTDHEAAARAGLDRPGVCWWKRCSELRQGGWIGDTGRTRTDPVSGAQQMVCEVTESGRVRARELGAVIEEVAS